MRLSGHASRMRTEQFITIFETLSTQRSAKLFTGVLKELLK